jgi:hypothetical protein
MARMYSILADAHEVVVEVFRDVEAAERWLVSLSGPTRGDVPS